jgi:hypothetical protein
MRIFTFSLPAGEPVTFAVTGSYFRVISADDDFQVTFIGPEITTDIMSGLGFRLEEDFTGIRLYSVTAQVVKIAAGRGLVDDSRLTGQVDLNGALQMLQSSATQVAQGSVTVTTAATLIVAANLDRRSMLMQLDEAAAGPVWYGTTSGVTTSNGIKIKPGGSLSIENAQPVYLIGTTSVTVNYLEEIN